MRRFVAFVAGGRGVQRICHACNETPSPATKCLVLQRNRFWCNETPFPATKRLLVQRKQQDGSSSSTHLLPRQRRHPDHAAVAADHDQLVPHGVREAGDRIRKGELMLPHLLESASLAPEHADGYGRHG